ncbi:MAG: toxin HipA [Chlamydiae bacterium]|jgi:serine/threonine-protein kinase HipA|nr:toxin HipA [Chlamydiota bacterium]
MKKANVYVNGIFAGILEEVEYKKLYKFTYAEDYQGSPVSLTMPTSQKEYSYDRFPPFFDGLLPEGLMLESLLKKKKIDRSDYMSQLLVVGKDMVGNVTVEQAK